MNYFRFFFFFLTLTPLRYLFSTCLGNRSLYLTSTVYILIFTRIFPRFQIRIIISDYFSIWTNFFVAWYVCDVIILIDDIKRTNWPIYMILWINRYGFNQLITDQIFKSIARLVFILIKNKKNFLNIFSIYRISFNLKSVKFFNRLNH